ncbi:Similar to Supt7l: STAGA complex 65 subunit gamma (Mus musculus) [Cotesia congregata]|uniref:Similar to Supt7l: STAGA complex 65 subunit gamma (Mus musculus) n=1 Tax=Cotesia congregata TaxID=51543 RepID=A0A8J2E604_COTCN|nr:Similar to Supt7l: STAGA complex 65 subunit gamma (Mus musculus) [Cotesia congregata]
MKSSKNNGSSSTILWGELPTRENHKQEVITPDIIENIWRQVLDDCGSNNSEMDNYQTEPHPEFIQLPMENSLVLNTVALHRQKSSINNGLIVRGISTVEKQEEKPSNPFKFLPPREKREINKKFTCNLQPSTCRSLLKHAVTVLIAHIGYEQSVDTAIETLVDVAETLLRKITMMLKFACEQPNSGFPDPVERILVETGIGNVEEIHNYYQNYVVKFEEGMRKTVEAMVCKQQMELSSAAKMELDEVVNKLQFDDLENFVNAYKDVPTLQLLDPEIGFPPSLDAGFQMLHSLEQDELNNLEAEEEDSDVHHINKKYKK